MATATPEQMAAQIAALAAAMETLNKSLEETTGQNSALQTQLATQGQQSQVLKTQLDAQFSAATTLAQQNVELEQRLANLATTTAATAASQSAKLANLGGSLVDTRQIGKPEKWDGKSEGWKEWHFVTRSYLIAANRVLAEMLQRTTLAAVS